MNFLRSSSASCSSNWQNGFTAKQNFNLNETGPFSKYALSRTFISKEKKSEREQEHKTFKNRLMLYIAGDEGDDV